MQRLVEPVLFVAALVLAWQAWVVLGDVDTIVAPHPADVASDLLEHPGLYLSAAADTLRTAGAGLVIGTTVGSLLAGVVWCSAALGAFLAPAVQVLRLAPIVALIPIFARVLGYGVASVIAVTAMLSFSFAYVLVGSGLRSGSVSATDVVSVYGGGRRQVLRQVAIPSAAPALSTAIRIGATASVLAALAAEFLIGTEGLGALFVESRLTYANVARSWGVAVTASVLSGVVFLSTSKLEHLTRRRFT